MRPLVSTENDTPPMFVGKTVWLNTHIIKVLVHPAFVELCLSGFVILHPTELDAMAVCFNAGLVYDTVKKGVTF